MKNLDSLRSCCCACYQGRQQWSMKMPENIIAVEVLDYKAKNVTGLLVALGNSEVRTYIDKTHVDTIVTEDVVVAMKFGRFGREEATLVMITKGQLVALSSMMFLSSLVNVVFV